MEIVFSLLRSLNAAELGTELIAQSWEEINTDRFFSVCQDESFMGI